MKSVLLKSLMSLRAAPGSSEREIDRERWLILFEDSRKCNCAISAYLLYCVIFGNYMLIL